MKRIYVCEGKVFPDVTIEGGELTVTGEPNIRLQQVGDTVHITIPQAIEVIEALTELTGPAFKVGNPEALGLEPIKARPSPFGVHVDPDK